jgi:hypothetical protein
MLLRRCACLLLLLPAVLGAYNHPELRWKSVTTEHFIITFYDRTEPAVYPTWKIAEEAYKVLAPQFNYALREKISISLADYEDFSNGFAEWTAANIQIWLPDLRFDLRNNSTWLRNVITHELTHIISLEQKRRMQTIDVSLGIGVSSPDEELAIQEPFARITGHPSWMAEGIAQFETEQQGNDAYDSRREMALRGAVLSNSLLTLDEMGSFNHDSYNSEMVYNQGFAFTRFIAGRIGLQRLHSLFTVAATEPVEVRRWFIEKAGVTLDGLYRQWTDSLKATFTARFPDTKEQPEIIAGNGRFNLRPEVSPDGQYWAWLTSGRDDGGRTDLVVAQYGSTRPLYRIPHAHTVLSFSASSDRIYFVKSRVPDRNGSFFNELYSLALPTGTATRLTSGGRVYDVAPLPGGDLLCIRYMNAAFGLYRCSPEGATFRELAPGEQGSPFLSIAQGNRDTTFAIVTKIVSGKSTLLRYDATTRQLTTLVGGKGHEESPFVAPDNRIYFNADYDGVFNVYSCRVDGTDLQRHTSTAGGHFSPKIGPDGKLITSWFSANRFAIARQTVSSAPYSLPDSGCCGFLPLPVPKGTVTIKSRPYEPKLRRGLWEVMLAGQVVTNNSLLTGQVDPERDTATFLIMGGLVSSRSDALQKRMRAAQLLMGIETFAASEPRDMGGTEYPAAPRKLQLAKTVATQWVPPMADKATPRIPHTLFQKNALSLQPARFRRMAYSSATGSSDTMSTVRPQFILVAMPSVAFENSVTGPTLGIELSTQLLYSLLPASISAAPYFEVQIEREWYAGGRIDLGSMPFGGLPLFGSIPLYLQWNHLGYVNEDLSYNYADVTQLQLAAGPRFIPSLCLSGTVSRPDTTVSVVRGWVTMVSLFHGVPLFKYGALQLSSSTIATYHQKKTLDDNLFSVGSGSDAILDGESNGYMLSTNGIRGVFPIVRTINRGSKNYFDAFYGHVGFTLIGYANSSFFDRFPEDKARLLSDPDYRPESVYIEQAVSAGLQLGRYKSSLFFSTIDFEVTYMLMRSMVHLSLTSGF